MLGNVLIGFFIVVTVSVVINHYVFSWVGIVLSRAGLCEYKSIHVPARNGGDKRLSFPVDLAEVAAALSPNPDYKVRHDDFMLLVTRIYGDVEYNMRFINGGGGDDLVSYFHLSTYTARKSKGVWRKCSDDPNGYYSVQDEIILIGEKCGTPAYRIKRNVYRMIRDLPLGYLQRAELKVNVRVGPVSTLRLF